LKKLNMAVVAFSVCLGAVGVGMLVGDALFVVVAPAVAVVVGATGLVGVVVAEPPSSPPPQAESPSTTTMVSASRRRVRMPVVDMEFPLFRDVNTTTERALNPV
jgi:hypothetical protein